MIKLTYDIMNEFITDQDDLSVIKFYGDNCQACKVIDKPVELASKQLDVKYYSINADTEKQLVEKFNVTTLPTIIIYNNGKEVKRFFGTLGENAFVMSEFKKIITGINNVSN